MREGGYRNSPTLFPTTPSLTPLRPPLSPTMGFTPHPKLQSLLSQEWVKLRTSNFARTITGPIPSEEQPTKNFGEKEAWAYPGTAQFFGYPLLSQEQV